MMQKGVQALTIIFLLTVCTLAPRQAIGRLLIFQPLGKQAANPGYLEARNILEKLYRGENESALALAEAFQKNRPESPLPFLIKARVLRERLSDQDDDKKLVKKSAEPIYRCLNRAIDLCNLRLKSGDDDSKYLFYRGWAWMFKAQLDALGGSYWSAGRNAKKGKKELDKYLRINPKDPDAQGILGTFLYFADTMPSIIKIIKSFFLIPGGDRERGLELLNYASSRDGLLSVDHKIILSAVYTLFEGRFEIGIRSFAELLEKYPFYLRLVEPLGVVAAFSPGHIRKFQALESTALARHLESPPGSIDWETVQRLRYHRSYSYIFFNTPGEAIKEFRSIVASRPKRPDWLIPLSLINLGIVYANSGRIEEANKAFEAVLADPLMKRFHSVARKMREKASNAEGSLDHAYSRLAEAIYDRRPDEAQPILEDYRRVYGETVHYYFYLGEMKLLDSELGEAELAYTSALKGKVPEVSQVYQMFAAVRLAEIMGFRKDYESAGRFLDKALDYYHKEFLVDMLIRGRKRFYAELAANKIHDPPSPMLSGMGLLLPAPILKQ